MLNLHAKAIVAYQNCIIKIMKSKVIIIVLLIGITSMLSCRKILPSAPKDEEILAGTIPGLTRNQSAEHLAGDQAFGRIFTKEDGLGPLFIQTSCSNCHVG